METFTSQIEELKILLEKDQPKEVLKKLSSLLENQVEGKKGEVKENLKNYLKYLDDKNNGKLGPKEFNSKEGDIKEETRQVLEYFSPTPIVSTRLSVPQYFVIGSIILAVALLVSYVFYSAPWDYHQKWFFIIIPVLYPIYEVGVFLCRVYCP